MLTVAEAAAKFRALREQLDRVIIGQERAKEHVLAGLLAGGHLLLEGPPGTGKTLLVLALSRLLGCSFNRIQCTPDLIPSDITGSRDFNSPPADFEFHQGPLFAEIVLVDEIERTLPQTQSAFLEAMQDSAISVDGFCYHLSPLFTVFATRQPTETEGPSHLPAVELDRFMMTVRMNFPADADEIRILEHYARGNRLHSAALNDLGVALSADDLMACRRTAAKLIRVEAPILATIQRIISATRHDAALVSGAGPRALLALLDAGRALALMRGRNELAVDEIKELTLPVLRHRVVLSNDAKARDDILEDVLNRLLANSVK